MTGITFEGWPKIARLNRDMVITEKIDGTNAAVIIADDGQVGAQSRKRLITPDDDNFGFARWVAENAGILADVLGPGRHFGEWWGSGIQRGYGLTNGEKRFSLFNVNRYAEFLYVAEDGLAPEHLRLSGLDIVPVLYRGPFRTDLIRLVVDRLELDGSNAAPGFMRPEGIIVYHQAAGVPFKVTIDGDEAPKSAVA